MASSKVRLFLTVPGFFSFTNLTSPSIWRPLFGPLYDWPLAVCDWKSVDPTLDLVPSDNVYTHTAAETYNIYHNPDHRWYYMDAMQPNETLVFKSFDSRHSDETARGKFVSCHLQRLQKHFLYCANYRIAQYAPMPLLTILLPRKMLERGKALNA